MIASNKKTKVTLIGAGNVAWHLGRSLHAAGVEIVQVFSRKLLNASELAQEVGANPTDDLQQTSPAADLYLLAVHDGAIAEVLAQLPLGIRQKKLIAHTSGATPMQVFVENVPPNWSSAAQRHGIFYPLQTFSRHRATDMAQVPFCIDANSETDADFLKNLALRLSPKVHRLDDRQRAQLHLAAVISNNFTNHLFAVAKELLEKQGMPFDLLLPLIRETVAKLDSGDPRSMQTGPARRRDNATIERHLNLLETEPKVREIYRLLTAHIWASH